MTLLKTGLLSLVGIVFLTGFEFGFGKDSPEEQRTDIDQKSEEILSALYREVPGSDKLIAGAAGHAVFSSLGMNVLAVSTANGKGVATYADSGQKVYTNMFSAGGGVGMGVKKFLRQFTPARNLLGMPPHFRVQRVPGVAPRNRKPYLGAGWF